jgi:hypothetical protein
VPRFQKLLLVSFAFVSLSVGAQPIPQFDDYRVTEIFRGAPARPVLATSEQRRYRTRITAGVSESFKPGPNFAGHYVVIQWGCGSQCVMMAIVDTKTGAVYDPPLSGTGSELYIPLDNLSKMETEYHRGSSLMVLRDACRNFRGECGTYYFNWRENKFALVKFVKTIDNQQIP